MKKLLSILILLGLGFIPLPVHAAESGSLIVRTVAARLHSDKTITVTETLKYIINVQQTTGPPGKPIPD